jgi:hypothetical protein
MTYLFPNSAGISESAATPICSNDESNESPIWQQSFLQSSYGPCVSTAAGKRQKIADDNINISINY